MPEDGRLALAVALALEVGRHVTAWRADAAVAWKGPGERVTDADVRAQTEMVGAIRRSFPADGVIAEEGERVPAAGDPAFVWVLDPLDGTNNYAIGIPCFAISIGILHHGWPWAGVVHDPNTGFTCRAMAGHGAWMESRRLTVSSRPLDVSSNVSVRVPVDPSLEPVIAGWLRRYKLRGFGSVALHLAYAALGAIDLILDHKAALWDIAGGAAILLEAGGRITDPLGRAIFPVHAARYEGAPLPFLAGNPSSHNLAVTAFRGALGSRPTVDHALPGSATRE
jgi:myo-inositol-1(or 4)-monophosphatase